MHTPVIYNGRHHSWLTIIMMTIPATSLMTLFSYLYSRATHRNYKEPVLLAMALQKGLHCKAKPALVSGWLAHYAMGLVFCACMVSYQNKKKHPTPMLLSLFQGMLGGLAGSVIWKIIFTMQKNKPAKEREYYAQLIIAHMVFGLSVHVHSRMAQKAEREIPCWQQVGCTHKGD